MRGAALLLSVPLLLGSACSRTGLWQLVDETGGGGSGGSAGSPPRLEPECELASDCPLLDPCAPPVCVYPSDGQPAFCQAKPLDCDDGEPCTADRCDPERGACENVAPADADGDGHVGRARDGAPARCGGLDCDDADAAVHPGATELCNGKDDDCDGSIDEDSVYSPRGTPVRLAGSTERSQHGGIAWNGSAYGVSFSLSAVNDAYFGLLAPLGQWKSEPERISQINADTYAGTVGWSGESFLTVWADARQANNYELYATRFDGLGRKLSADLRLTDAPDFSLRPVLRFTGTEYLLTWDEHRFEDSGGGRAIYGLRLSASGTPLDGEVRLTPASENADFSALAVNEERAILVYLVNNGQSPGLASVRVRTFDLAFGSGSEYFELSGDGQEPSIVRVRGGFLVAWSTGSPLRGWGSSIHAALLDEQGRFVRSAVVTSGDTFARWRTLVPLGERTVLVWSGTEQGARYSLYYQTLSGLDPVSPRALLATSSTGGDLMDPVAVLGQSGDIGVLYDDDRSGVVTAYFTRLSCNQDAPR